MRAAVAALAVSLVLTGCASSSFTPDASTPSIDLVQMPASDLGWGGIFLGRTRTSVGEALGQPLPLRREEPLACGVYHSALTLYGRRVDIQWSSDLPTAVVESVYVEITPEERATPAAQLVRRLRARLAKLVEADGSRAETTHWAYLTPRHRPSQALLLKSGEENFLYLALAACFD